MTTPPDPSKRTVDESTIPPISHFKPLAPPPPYRPPLSKRLISALSMFYIFLSAYLGCIFMQGFFLPLVYLFPAYFKVFVENSMLLWFRLTEIVLAKFMDIRVHHFGDKFTEKGEEPDEMPNFLIMTNHRTRLDWFYFWLMGQHFHQMKICLKGELAQIPGAGWAMQFGNFLFLKRRLEEDKKRIKQLVNYLKSGDKVQIFIFPEGTDLSPEAMRRSAIYSKKVDKVNPHYTLHPRTSGIIHLINSALPKHLDYIYNVTVAYPDNFSVNELDMITGQSPENVHLLWIRIPLSEVPLEVDEATGRQFAGDKARAWIEDIWQKKELLLKHYYSFPIGQRTFHGHKEHPIYNTCFKEGTTDLTNLSLLIFLYWAFYNVFIIYSIYSNYMIRSYFLLFHVVILFISYRRAYGLSDFISELSGYPLNQPATLNGSPAPGKKTS